MEGDAACEQLNREHRPIHQLARASERVTCPDTSLFVSIRMNDFDDE